MNLDLLAFGPHPDDVEFSCGGWVASATARGQRVGLVDLTAGELATNGTPAVRAVEAQHAAEVLGAAFRECLGLPDGGVDSSTPAVDAVVEVLRRTRPFLVLAPWIEARHPDHSAAGKLLQRAHFLGGLARYRPDLGDPWRASRLVHYPQRHEGPVDFVVDVTAVVATKRAAIAAHHSQVGPGTQTLINGAVGAAVWETRDRYWGASIGVTFGEPYILGGPVPVADPVSHLRAHPGVSALVPRR